MTKRLGHVRSDDDNGQAVGGDNEVRLHAEGGEQAAHRELQHGTGGQKHGHQDEILDGQSLLLSRSHGALGAGGGGCGFSVGGHTEFCHVDQSFLGRFPHRPSCPLLTGLPIRSNCSFADAFREVPGRPQQKRICPSLKGQIPRSAVPPLIDSRDANPLMNGPSPVLPLTQAHGPDTRPRRNKRRRAFPLSLGDPFTLWRSAGISAAPALCECPDGLTFASSV